MEAGKILNSLFSDVVDAHIECKKQQQQQQHCSNIYKLFLTDIAN